MRGTAAVVGGGIGGLAAALGLRRVGWDVTVLERSAVPDDAGAAISLAANGLRALDELGVGEAVRAASHGQYRGGTRRPDGRWLARMDGAALERAVGSPIVGITRAELHRLLRAALPAEALLIGVRALTVEHDGPGRDGSGHDGPGHDRPGQDGPRQDRPGWDRPGWDRPGHDGPGRDRPGHDGSGRDRPGRDRPGHDGPGRVRVGCSDGTRCADLVVAADGVGSRLRGLLLPEHPGAVATGTAVLRAITDQPVALEGEFELTWGRGAEFGHIVLPDGRAEWHAVLPLPPGTRFADPLAELRSRFGGWHEPIPELLAATRPDAVLHHDLRELRTPLTTFTVGRVALLGDAAHAMTPHLGQGACQALEDAVTLAAAVADAPDLPSALSRYDATRRPRAQAVARAARQAGRMGPGLSHPLAVAVRNSAMPLMPPGPTLRAILRHHVWEPPTLNRTPPHPGGPAAHPA
ncbi:FAD-dependent monooxygenase [Kitasatospora sp. NPDC059673]|uniref:FAD-dependent monooxygenase n=1 Tax=Kitasatospora sp. NPDC059673 TaxID=3346901 RepID=UPI0036AB64F7